MKSNKKTKNLAAMMVLLAIGAQAPSVMAQDDLLTDTDSVLNSEQIDVDGAFEAKPRTTQADRIEKLRKNLEERNEQMVQKKIEDMRMREEQKLAKKLQSAFQGGLQNMDQVSTKQAAPQPPKVIVQKVVAPKKKAKNTKVIPTAGLLNVNGDSVDFDADVNAGISIESMVHNRVSVGVGFGYTTMKITDVANTYITSQPTSYWNGYSTGYVSPYTNGYQYVPGYQNTYGQGREMSYKRLALELNAKFYMTVETTIKPYVGTALGYNRTSLVYENNQSYNSGSYSFGDEKYNSNYVSGSALVGAEINFSESIGMNVDFRYSAAITDGSGESGFGYNTHPDQERLENVGGRIQDADHMSLNAGLVIKF